MKNNMNDKLYGVYTVISKKTVRQNEIFYKKYRTKNKFIKGRLVKTNRGFFIDGHQVDVASMLLWHKFNNDAELASKTFISKPVDNED